MILLIAFALVTIVVGAQEVVNQYFIDEDLNRDHYQEVNNYFDLLKKMKLKLNKDTLEEPKSCQFQLKNNFLTMVNVFTGSKSLFIDSREFMKISDKDLQSVKNQLLENNRIVL